MDAPRKDIHEVLKIRPPGQVTIQKKAAKEAVDSMRAAGASNTKKDFNTLRDEVEDKLKVSEVGGRLMITPTKFTLTLPTMTAGELARYFASLNPSTQITKTICDGDPVRIT